MRLSFVPRYLFFKGLEVIGVEALATGGSSAVSGATARNRILDLAESSPGVVRLDLRSLLLPNGADVGQISERRAEISVVALELHRFAERLSCGLVLEKEGSLVELQSSQHSSEALAALFVAVLHSSFFVIVNGKDVG